QHGCGLLNRHTSDYSACASTLRITFGKASPASSARADQRDPSGAAAPVGSLPTYTTSSSGKCVNTCVTTPGKRRQFGVARPNRGAWASAALESKSCAHCVVGTSVIPPSRPLGGRVRTSTQPSARTATNAAPWRSLPSFLGALIGKRSASPRRRAAHGSLHGQSAHSGLFGAQIVAPRSISACARSPAR